MHSAIPHSQVRFPLAQGWVLPRRCLTQMLGWSLTWEEHCFSFIPTRSVLHQPFVIYGIFMANIVMKPHFVQIEAVTRELQWFGDERRWRVRCEILFLSQVRKTSFEVDPGHVCACAGGGNPWKAKDTTGASVWNTAMPGMRQSPYMAIIPLRNPCKYREAG